MAQQIRIKIFLALIQLQQIETFLGLLPYINIDSSSILDTILKKQMNEGKILLWFNLL